MATAAQREKWVFKHWVFPAYRRAFRPRKKLRKRRPTDRGQLIITGAVLTAALGLNTETSFVYQLFALLFCLALAGRFGLQLSKPNVTVRRVLPKYATAGQEFTYRIRITNKGDEVESDLTITDMPTPKLPTLQQFKAEKEPFEDSRNAYDRLIGFHRFMYLHRQLTGITTTPGHVDEIAIRGHRDIHLTASPLRRGKIEFGKTAVLHQDPLALNYGYQHFENPESLLVLPERFRLNPNWQVSTGRNFQPGGITSAWSIGESDEFVSLRDYRDGDSMRKIHWPSSAKQAARKQNLVVKEYQDEFFARNALILDIDHPLKLNQEIAVSVASSFALELQQSESMLDLIYLNHEGTRIITAGRGTSSVNKQLEALATMEPVTDQFETLTETSIAHARLVTGCICIFANWQDQHSDLIKRLSAMDTNLTCLVISEESIEGPFTTIRPSRAQEDLLKL